MAAWIAANCGKSTPCHLTAYHPSYNYHQAATTTTLLTNAWRIFKTRLDYVYLGNIPAPGGSDTVCAKCGKVVVARKIFAIDQSGMRADGHCANCGADNHLVII